MFSWDTTLLDGESSSSIVNGNLSRLLAPRAAQVIDGLSNFHPIKSTPRLVMHFFI